MRPILIWPKGSRTSDGLNFSPRFKVMRVSMEFAQNFDGHEVEIGKMLMLVTEQTIAKACRLVVGGERWWKKEHEVTVFVNQFLLPNKKKIDWRREIPRN